MVKDFQDAWLHTVYYTAIQLFYLVFILSVLRFRAVTQRRKEASSFFSSFRLHNQTDLSVTARETTEDEGDFMGVHFDQGTPVCLYFFH